LFLDGTEFVQVKTRRVIRGGSLGGAPVNLWVEYRDSHPPDGALEFVGFAHGTWSWSTIFSMKKELSPKQILAIRCPTCGAKAGEKCGQPRTNPHRDRKYIAAD